MLLLDTNFLTALQDPYLEFSAWEKKNQDIALAAQGIMKELLLMELGKQAESVI